MAARVNRNFVALLVVVLVAVVGLGFVAYAKLYHQTADQLRVEGETHLVEARRYAAEVDQLSGEAALTSYRRSGEEFEQATSLFGQAFTKEPTNLEVLQNYIDSLEQMHAGSRLKAQEFHQELMNKRKLAVELSGNAPDRLEAYYRGLMDMASWAGEGVYQAVFREAENRLAVNPKDPISMKYRGIVGSLRLSDSTDLNAQRAVLDDLDKARAERPSDPELALALAGYQLFEAERVAADAPAFDAAMEAAMAAITEADDAADADRRVRLGQAEARLRAVRLLRQTAADRERQGAAADRVEALRVQAAAVEDVLVGTVGQLEASVAESPGIDDLVRTADLLTAVDRTSVQVGDDIASTGGLQRTETLVRRAIQAEPLNVSYKVMLGNLLRLRQQHDEALTVYREADGLEAVGPAEMMLRTDARRRQARFEIASIELIKAEAAADSDEREKLLKGAEDAVEELVNAENRTARVLLLEGKIALLRNQTTKAMQALDRAVQIYSDTGQPNVEAILLSARARQSERQWGAAADRLETLLSQYPLERSPATERRIRRQLTEIYLASNRTREAEQQVQRLRALAPDDSSTAALDAQLALEQGRVEEAESIFRDAGLLGNESVVRRLAEGYSRSGRSEEAVTLLRGFLDEQPGSVAVLAELLPRLEPAEREQRLAAAEAAGAGSDTLLMLRGAETPEERQQIVDSLAVRGGGSELDEQFRRADLWERLQEPEKATAAYERARQLDPDNPRLLMEDLRVALAAGDMDKANGLAERASQENLDLAGGRFIRAQVAAAQGDTGRAIVLYREGLQERPVYDQGWTTLGDLLLREGNAADAVEAFSQATSQRPDNVGALVGLANAQRARGRQGAALSALRSAVEVNPDNAQIREQYLAFEAQQGDPQRALDFREARVKQRPDDLGNRIEFARLLEQRGQTQEAMEQIDAAAERPEAGVAVAAARADLLARTSGPDAGVASMDRYLDGLGSAAGSNDFVAYGRFLAGLGRNDAATQAFRRAAEMEPADDPVRAATRELGDHLFAIGAASEAAAVYRDLLASDSLTPEDRQRVTLRQAETLLRAGDADGAEALLAGQDTAAEGLLLRAMIASNRGDTDAARAAIDKAIAAAPGSATAYLQRATLPGTDPQAALADAERAAELQPGDDAADRLRVGLLVSLGRLDDAASLLAGRLDRNAGDVQARVQLTELRLAEGREDEARRLIDTGRGLDPEQPVWDRFEQQIAANSSDDATAIAALRTALAENPAPETLARLTRRLLTASDPAAAADALEGQPAMLQELPVLQALRGRVFAAAGDTESARNVLRTALSRVRNPGEYAGALGEAAAAVGPVEAISLASADPPAIDAATREIIDASVLLNGGEAEAAVALLDRDDSPAAAGGEEELVVRRLRLLATALQGLGRADEARQRYEELLELRSDDAASLNNLAFLLAMDLDRPTDAIPLARRAVDLLPAGSPPVQRAAVLDTLGWAQHLAGDDNAARGTLEESLRLTAIPAAHLHLAHVYRGLGLDTLAEDQARRAEQLAGEQNDADVLTRLAEFREGA